MPLIAADPPDDIRTLVRARLQALAATNGFRTARLRGAAPLSLSTPHRLARLHYEHVDRGATFRNALTGLGWRFLVHAGHDVVAAADAHRAKDGAPQFGHLNEGPLVNGTEQAIRWAEAQPQIAAGRYEPLLVTAPDLCAAFLLLHDLDAETDLLVAIPPLPPGLSPFSLIGPAETAARLFSLSRLRERAGVRVGPTAHPTSP